MDIVAWSSLAGILSAAAASLLTLWWTKGTDSRIRLIKAESDAKHRSQSDIILQKDAELARKEQIIMEKNELIADHAKRLEVLEANYERLRESGHEERNKWYEEQLKCHADNAELRGQLSVVSAQLQQLYSYMYPTKSPPPPVSALTPLPPTNPIPVSVVVAPGSHQEPLPVRRVE